MNHYLSHQPLCFAQMFQMLMIQNCIDIGAGNLLFQKFIDLTTFTNLNYKNHQRQKKTLSRNDNLVPSSPTKVFYTGKFENRGQISDAATSILSVPNFHGHSWMFPPTAIDRTHLQLPEHLSKNPSSATVGHVPCTCIVIGQSLSGVNGQLITFEHALSFTISLGQDVCKHSPPFSFLTVTDCYLVSNWVRMLW